jgi:hypothetical protein
MEISSDNPIRELLRDTWLHRLLVRRREQRILSKWAAGGRRQPPPPEFKQALIRGLGRSHGLRVLVETGTFLGNTVAANLDAFQVIHSIELSEEFYRRARRRFAQFPKVRLWHGDSTYVLASILGDIDEPAVFWLDAHFSGTGTARGASDTPIGAELQIIARHPVKRHLILIDDARCFDGTNSYPTIDECRVLATQLWPDHRFVVEDDIIRIIPV